MVEQKKPVSLAQQAGEGMKPQGPHFGLNAEEKPRGGAGKGVNFTGDYRGAEQGGAAQTLAGAEKAATDNGGQTNNATDAENNPNEVGGGFYTGDGGRQDKKGNRVTGIFKKKGPMAVVAMVVVLVGTFIIGGQVTMPFSILSQFQETLDSIKESNVKRTRTIFRKQLSNTDLDKGAHPAIYKRYFGFGGTVFKIHDKQRAKLKKQGIYVIDDFGGTKKTAMVIDEGGDKLSVVAANEADAETFRGVDPKSVNLEGIDELVDFSKLEVDTKNAAAFQFSYNNNANFRNGYIAGSRNWRGSVGAWFDKTTVKFLQRYDLTRNRFLNFQERVKEEMAGNPKAKRKAMQAVASESMELDEKNMNSNFTNREDNSKTETDPETGESKVEPSSSVENNGLSFKSKGMTSSEVSDQIKNFVKKRAGKEGGNGSAAQIACTVMDIVGAINLMIVAQQTQQLLSVVSGYFEGIDKVKAGDGNDSPVHTLSEALVKPRATTEIKFDKNGNEIGEEVMKGKENTSAMKSAGMKALYGNFPVDTEDESVKNFNINSKLQGIFDGIGVSMTSFTMCGIAKMAEAGLNIGVKALQIGVCIATVGAGCVAQAVFGDGLVKSLALSVGVAAIIEAVLPAVLPAAVQWFTKDLATDLGGEELGNAIVSGANKYMGRNHLTGGGSPASQDDYVKFAVASKQVEDEIARFERETRNPFDITSQYTFLGHITNQLASVQTISSPVTGVMGTLGAMLSSSLTNLLPSASAYDVEKNLTPLEEYEKTCPYLASIGAVGDAYCNPYMISDIDTIEDDPIDVVDTVYDLDKDPTTGKSKNLDDETGAIKSDGNLAKYVKYCTQRQSEFGTVDQNFVNDFTMSSGNTIIDSIFGSLPIIGDVLQIVESIEQNNNQGWISGESCVAKDEAVSGGGSSWSENQYYQRYVEDQRYMESIDPDYTSTVTAYLEEEERENPLDNSYEGMIARLSGLSKNQVTEALDLMNYVAYIMDYDPSERVAFGEEKFEVVEPMNFDNVNEVVRDVQEKHGILLNAIAYADVRNRTVMA